MPSYLSIPTKDICIKKLKILIFRVAFPIWTKWSSSWNVGSRTSTPPFRSHAWWSSRSTTSSSIHGTSGSSKFWSPWAAARNASCHVTTRPNGATWTSSRTTSWSHGSPLSSSIHGPNGSRVSFNFLNHRKPFHFTNTVTP